VQPGISGQLGLFSDRLQAERAMNRGRVRLKYDGTCAETRFLLSVKRTSPFKTAGASVQSTTGSSRGVRISRSNARYTKFRGSVKSTGYPLHSPLSPSLPLPCVTVCHHISTGLYIPRRVGDFSLLHNDQTGLSFHPPSYSVGTCSSFHGGVKRERR